MVALENTSREIANASIGNRIAQLDGKAFEKEIKNLTRSIKENQDEQNFKKFGKK